MKNLLLAFTAFALFSFFSNCNKDESTLSGMEWDNTHTKGSSYSDLTNFQYYTIQKLELYWLQEMLSLLCTAGCGGREIYCAVYNNMPAIHITAGNACTDEMGLVYDFQGNFLDSYGGIGGKVLEGTLVDGQMIWSADADCKKSRWLD